MVRVALALCLLLSALCASTVHAQGTRVSMSASSNRVAVGEPFAVEIRIEQHGDEPDSVELPDFGSLELLGRSTSKPFSFSFGFGGGQRARVKSETIYGFTLRALERGAFSIRPAIVTVNGRRIASQPLNIIAVEGSSAARATQGTSLQGGYAEPRADPDADEPPPLPEGQPVDGAKVDPTMFLRTVVDKKRAYLGEQVTVTVYLYLRGQLGDSPQITREPTLEGFWSNDLLPMQRSMSASRQEVEGRSYSVYILRRFAAFPLRTGKLDVGAPAVEVGAGGSIFDLLNGPGRPTRRDGMKVSVEVLPLPAQPSAHAPTFTGTLSLEAALDSAQVKVGEAVTLRVVAKGQGNLRALSLTTPRLEHVEILAPEIDDQVERPGDVIGGTRSYRWLLLPRSPGQVSIPSFVVDVFDPATQSFSTARSAPLSLAIGGAEAEAKPSAEPVATDDPSARFGPVRATSELLRKAVPLHERAFYWPLVLAAPLLLLALFALQQGKQRLALHRAGNQGSVQQQAVEAKLAEAQQASARGDANGALSALASALKKAVESRLGQPVGGMTLRALEQHLAEQALEPKLAARVIAQLGALERGRFDPGAQGQIGLNQALEGVRAVVSDLASGKSRGRA